MKASEIWLCVSWIFLLGGIGAAMIGSSASAAEAEAVANYASHLWVASLLAALWGRWVKTGE